MDPQLSVVIPAYNEEDGLESGCRDLREVLSKLDMSFEIIIVNDGSTDRTGEIADSIEGVKLVKHAVNKGYGASLKSGIRAANGQSILITDADGTYPASEIPHLLSFAEYDMVVGSRTGKNISIPLYRKPAKWFLTKLANYLSGQKIPDLNSGMRVFKKEDAKRFFNILPDGFSFTTTITLSYHANGLTVKYIPIDYNMRVGSSKIKPFKDGFNFILLIFKSVTYFNPLKIFLPISVILFLLALITLLYSIFVVGAYFDTTMLILLMSSIQIALFGLLADMVRIQRI